jgi:GDPmannose 4,6-dehydratase
VRDFCRLVFECLELNYEDYISLDQKLLRPAEVDSLCGDYSKARTKLNWTPATSLEDMVKEMVEADLARHRAFLAGHL